VEGAREGHRAAALEPKSNENLRVGNDTGLRASGDRDEERER